MIVDVHAHCVPKELNDLLLQRHGLEVMRRPQLAPQSTPVDDSDDDVARRLRLMDEAGVDVQVLSLPPIAHPFDEAETIEIMRIANDRHARMAAKHPDRFVAYVQLPLPFVEASLAELRRATEQLGLSAATIWCAYGATSGIAEELDPVYEELDRLGCVVLFHPVVNGLCSPLVTDYRLEAVLGPLLEDSVLLGQMVARQFPLRFPNIKMIVPHLGGVLPIYTERMNNQMSRTLPDLPMRPADIARKMWYDTVSHSSPSALRSACESLGADRLVTGSDYPFLEHFGGYADSINYVSSAGLSPEDAHAILHENAARLLGLTGG